MSFYFIINNIIYILFIFSVGFLMNKKIFKIDIDRNLTIIFGIIYISFFSLIINFFFPLSKGVNTIFLFLITLLAIINYKEILSRRNFKYFIIIGLINIFLILGSHHNRPDALIYHLPFIATLNEEKIIFGLNNINYRFGHTSIIQYLSAISNNYIFGINGISLYLPVAFSSLSYFFFKEIFKNKNELLGILSLFLLCAILLKLNRVSEYGNDYWAHFYFIIGFYLILKTFKKGKFYYSDFFQISLILCFAFLNKIFFLISLIFLAYTIIKFKKFHFIINKKNIFIFIFLLSFLLKNIINTGCLIYPISITCFDELSWTAKKGDYGYAEDVKIDSEAWSKDWPNYYKQNVNKISQSEYISDFIWFDTWKKNHLLIILKKIFPIILIMVFIFLILNKSKNKELIFNKFLIIISFLLLLIWFLKFPLYRFGLSILLIFLTCSFFYFLQNLNIKIFKKKYLILLVTCCVVVASFQNFKKIIKNSDNLIPKIYAYQNNQKIFLKDQFIMQLNKNDYCGFAKLCSNFDNSQKILLSNFMDYKIYKIKN